MSYRAERVFRNLRVTALLVLLIAAPAMRAAESDPNPSWFETVQTWMASLFESDETASEPDGGVIQIPGG